MAIMQDSTHPTGVSTTDPRGGSSVARARDRKANAALVLRRDGYSWSDIAKHLGFPTPRAALVAVETALEKGYFADETQEFMRRLAGQKLEILLFSVMRKAKDPDHPDHLAAVKEARMVVMDHAKLMGYLSPQEVAIYTPMAKEIEEFVGTILKDRQPETLEESDIFELTEQDDGSYAAPEQELIDF